MMCAELTEDETKDANQVGYEVIIHGILTSVRNFYFTE